MCRRSCRARRAGGWIHGEYPKGCWQHANRNVEFPGSSSVVRNPQHVGYPAPRRLGHVTKGCLPPPCLRTKRATGVHHRTARDEMPREAERGGAKRNPRRLEHGLMGCLPPPGPETKRAKGVHHRPARNAPPRLAKRRGAKRNPLRRPPARKRSEDRWPTDTYP